MTLVVSTPTRFGVFECLPRELKIILLGFLDGPATNCLSAVSKTWCDFIHCVGLKGDLQLGNLLSPTGFLTVRQVVATIPQANLTARVAQSTLVITLATASVAELVQLFELLNRGAGFTPTYLKAMLKAAAENGLAGGVKFLLTKVTLSADERCDLLLSAAKNGLARVVEVLLLKGIASAKLKIVLKEAVRRGDAAIVALLLTQMTLSEDERFEIAFEAMNLNQWAATLILLQSGPVPSYKVHHLLKPAAEGGPAEVVEALLTHSSNVQGDLDKAVELALGKDRLTCIKTWLTRRTLSEYHRGEFVEKAAEEGKLETVQVLLSNGPISAYKREFALREAAKKGHTKVVTFLLVKAELTDDQRGYIVNEAAGTGQTETVKILLLNGPITDQRRGWAAGKAVSAGHLVTFNLLIESGPLTEDGRQSLMREAAENGDLESVKTVVKKGTISKYDDQYRSRAALAAVKKGHRDVVIFLMEDVSLYFETSEAIVKHACEKEYYDVLEFLLSRKQITSELLSWMVAESVKTGRLKMLHILNKHGHLNGSRLGSAVCDAAKEGRTAAVKALLEIGSIPTTWRDLAVRDAAEKGDAATLRVLLDPRFSISASLFGWLSQDNRGWAVYYAAKGGHAEAIQAVLQDGSISEYFAGWALREAAERDFTNAVRALLQSGRISDYDRRRARENARKYSTVADLLDKKEESYSTTLVVAGLAFAALGMVFAKTR